MESKFCANHPGVAAVYRCDGCGKLLCGECAEEGYGLTDALSYAFRGAGG